MMWGAIPLQVKHPSGGGRGALPKGSHGRASGLISSMPVGDDVVVSLLLLIVDEGESHGDRRTGRVRDAEGAAQESALSDEIVCVSGWVWAEIGFWIFLLSAGL